MRSRLLTVLFAAATLAPSMVQTQTPPATGRGTGGRGIVGGVLPELELVKQFDRNGDNQLDAAERKVAREYLAANPQLRRSPGRGGGRISVTGSPGQKLTPKDVKSYPGVPLYDPGIVRTLFLEFDEADWEQQLADFYRTDVELPARLTVDGKLYNGVGVHFRGNNSFGGVPEGLKRPLTLSLDFIDPDQRLEGYRGLHLLNANQDPTLLRSILYLEVARHYISAPKANFVRVVINGESWGIYVNQQPFDKDFLRDAFRTTEGTRWKSPNNSTGGGFHYLGDDVAAYRRWYDMRSKEDPKAWTDLITLCRLIDTTPPALLSKAIAPLMDVDVALKFLALDITLINNDGYWNDGSDFNIYRTPQGRIQLVPHDVNEGFRAGGRGGAQLDPFVAVGDTNKALATKLLAAPDLRARYLGYVRDIAEQWLDWKRLRPIVERYQALIAADVPIDTRKLFATPAFRDGVYGDSASRANPPASTLKGFADQRRAFLLSHPEVASARRPQ